ncbi:hypothetical protein L917_12559 [Phytophthora nicotianae]|uniref:Uncharacterized protein n=3 Tax=Phytophthora nicotianae TaxID=4792 RepID=V9EI67_PHYNI|nr:hypothetical protein F443_16365 [Phytophthora nicotianae P1569]ETL88351.1 hypothetical protein L917_12559 [Phytophthora nicotianae]ETO58464.1 hypothetical protein F444_23163 [Phytophthora nicotianae P1976]
MVPRPPFQASSVPCRGCYDAKRKQPSHLVTRAHESNPGLGQRKESRILRRVTPVKADVSNQQNEKATTETISVMVEGGRPVYRNHRSRLNVIDAPTVHCTQCRSCSTLN